MLVIGTSDLSSIDTFPLVWRWTQVSHAVLSDEEIASIEPLRVEKARELQKLSRALEQNTALREVREINTDVLPEQDILTWLRHLPIIDDAVLVSWDEETGIRVPWSLFVRRWDDFCYPSSDDVSIIPLSDQWLLQYWHYGQFSWKHVNAT